MHVKILGSAAGGGFPQWNCACANCRSVRDGTFRGNARSQAQVAVSEDGVSWFLLGASPDLRLQIESCPELRPRNSSRHSPISGVVLTSAELDQCLGLLLLREFQPLNVYASGSVIRILREQNSMFAMLNREAKGVCWRAIRSGQAFSLCTTDGVAAGITCTPITASAEYPAYVRDAREFPAEDAVMGLHLSSANGKSLAYFPSCGTIRESVASALNAADLVMFDGTFYSDDELAQTLGSGPPASAMDHLPVGGEDGSLRQLASIDAKRKLYIHINNTNPMLNESGPEYRAVRDAGWELAEDGWQAVL